MGTSKRRKKDLGNVVAVAIIKGNITTLLTKDVKYYLVNGRVGEIERIDDYKSAVTKEFNKLRDQALTEFFSDEYTIQTFGEGQGP